VSTLLRVLLKIVLIPVWVLLFIRSQQATVISMAMVTAQVISRVMDLKK